jgi:hypothetical protein
LLERALLDETDQEFVSMLKDQIARLKKLIQEHNDVYFAYKLQHGEEAADDKRRKDAQERKDAELARQLQAQENNRNGAPPVAVGAAMPRPPANYPYVYGQPAIAPNAGYIKPAAPKKGTYYGL